MSKVSLTWSLILIVDFECQEFYVGLTTRRLCKRLYEHKK